ncbi:hypothetical protein QLQ12_13905 [Actinoplanes sp. NEAU-A12]|uniref:Uncharacterized protein n=2 Tax=Actinoplanes sandaracinus TaxID=3045177 RepID=A0ABT6WJ09_9ACTN|nr:hypothetical protein [Actinoplanes sandaracinus]
MQRPLTRRHRADLLPLTGGGEGGQPRRRFVISHNAIFAVAMLLSAVLVGLATVALH